MNDPEPAEGSSAPSRRWTAPLAAGVAGGVASGAYLVVAARALLSAAGRPLVGIDDACITMRYAINIANGFGFVYQAGGERVEGATSLLWTLLLSLAARGDAPQITAATMLVAAISAALGSLAAALGTALESAGVESPRSRAALLAPMGLWIAALPSYPEWAVISLMETGLWSALAVLLAAETVRAAAGGLDRGIAARAALWGVLAVAARPEAPLLVAGSTAILLALAGLGAWRRLLVVSAIPAAAFAALIGWRIWYFGVPLPNTYYAKVSPDLGYSLSEGFKYLGAFLSWSPLAAGAVAASAAVLGRLAWRRGVEGVPARLALAASLWVLLALALPVYGGGDHFKNFRFYQPFWPLFGLAPWCLALWLAVSGPATRRAGIVFAALFGIAVLVHGARDWRQTLREGPGMYKHEAWLAMEGFHIGRTLNNWFDGRPLPGLAVYTAGGVSLTYQGPLFDTLGLNDTEVARAPGDRRGMKNHAAFNPEIFKRRLPDLYAPFTLRNPEDGEAWAQSIIGFQTLFSKGIVNDQWFRDNYVPVLIPMDMPDMAAMFVYARPELVQWMMDEGRPVRVLWRRWWLAGDPPPAP
ncbi:MAG: hypothetical protein SF028_12575 [Candidatus Sumerlaeia bacterium]|nr:hypothetical protein [Candidatus Sumerlaeia bacterium]